MTSFFICGNAETICDGFTDERTTAWKSEIAIVFVEAAAKVIRDAGEDYEVASSFRDWHGGRFDQFYSRCGLIAVDRNASPAIEDVAWAADQAGSEARDAYIAELELQAAQ